MFPVGAQHCCAPPGTIAPLETLRVGRVAKRFDEFLIAENRSAKVRLGAAPLCLSRVRFFTLLFRRACRPKSIDPDQASLSLFVMRPTAPSPIFGMKDEFARDWIPMHVVQFLLQFLLAPH